MSDILIIGGGIIGLLTARELGLAGLEVTLIEMGETGRESSWAGGGILSPLYPWRYPDALTALVTWSQDAYPALATALHDETGIDPELTPSGLLILDPEEHAQATDWATRHVRRLQVIEGASLHSLEPALGPRPPQALLMPEVAQIRNPRLTKSIRHALGGRIRLHEQEEVIEILTDGLRVTGARTSKRTLAAERILVCAGAWTGRLLERLGMTLDIQPVRGQMLLFHGKPGQINHITLNQGRYVIPRRDGRVLFGSTVEHSDFIKSTTAEAREELYRAALTLFPLLKHTPIEDHWAGLRPGSPSGVPYIGFYPDISGLFLNAGHFRNGLVTAPASARLAADLVLGRDPVLDPRPYALNARR